jgi:hypothetical protein
MAPTDLVAARNRRSRVVLCLKRAAACRHQAANATDARLKAELLVYAAELEAKAREQRKPFALRRAAGHFLLQEAQRCRDLAASTNDTKIATELLRLADEFALSRKRPIN